MIREGDGHPLVFGEDMQNEDTRTKLHNLNNKIQGQILLAHLESDPALKANILSEIERLQEVVTMTEFFKVKETSEHKGVYQ